MAETTIHQILEELAAAATDHRDKGDKFERLTLAYLTTDPLYVARFSDVWMWNDWPDRKGKVDTGIDLVAKERDTGALVAIQCKFYAPSHYLQKGDIDSFLATSGKAPFVSRLLVSTTDHWSKHAEDLLDEQTIPVARLRVQDLDESAVDWSKFSLAKPDVVKLRTKKKLRKHQKLALDKVEEGFAEHERGKLIMACGTGKTFTSLKIMEHRVPANGLVLFLVPSISLLSQTLKEWTAEADSELRCFAVCSDTKVGKHDEDIAVHDLAFPATTDAKRLIQAIQARPKGDKRLTVIFSTYQSIDVISQAQKKGLGDFDLIVCDEAHRTTGVTLVPGDESAFVRVHQQKFIRADKRLYMTATPRIYSDDSKSKADDAGAEVASMDDVTKFGPEFHRLGFGEAVGLGLLADYKVMVLAVDEKSVSKTFQTQLADANSELNLEDAVKIVGCWNGLSKRMAKVEGDQTLAIDPHPMRRAVAFARDIKSSKLIADLFPKIVDQYIDGHDNDDLLRCEVEHVDGTFNVLRRNAKLDWLKEKIGDKGNICRILTNARCLSEGVDVPSLDAVLFLNPRDSVVDVVQSVGRVMRKSEGKKYGYIILPIGVPADLTPEEALKDNKRYKVVWQVLQALRAHDDRFNTMVNQIELNKARPDNLQVIGVGGGPGEGAGEGSGQGGAQQLGFAFPHLEEWRDAIYAKIVLKVGDRRYWEQWAAGVAEIAERHTTRIKALLETPNSKHQKAFDRFLKGLRQNINPSIEQSDAIEMLSQHLITKPVFDALFEGYSFAEHNPVSISMEKMLKALEGESLEKEAEGLNKFYAQVKRRAQGIDNAEGKQKVVYELYETFFKSAFKKMSDRLGIVYTPVQVVDFIIKSADEVLRKEFGVGLSDKGIHVLDPFTGTGTFMVRLLQSGLISAEDAKRKYANELHANELVLLAYYIAAINIEEAYHGLTGGDYTPFEGIVLTDTFQLGEGEGQFEEVFPENNKRAAKQKKSDIRVIIGNPPYSGAQDSANDSNANMKYKTLDDAIRSTYAERSSATNKSSLYNSYIRAFRWASDRIKDNGIVCYVSNGFYIDGKAADGIRHTFTKEFSSIYCFNLRGDQINTSGETSRAEGGKIFGSGSRSSIAITLMVKNKAKSGPCQLFYHDIGSYLSREDKLQIIQDFGGMSSVPWAAITPNPSHDWINQRDPAFEKFLPLASKNVSELPVFNSYSRGLETSRDAWSYSFNKSKVEANVKAMIEVYNQQLDRFWATNPKNPKEDIEAFIDKNPMRISWSRGLKAQLLRKLRIEFNAKFIRVAVYRPFVKMYVYMAKDFNEYTNKIPRYMPTEDTSNILFSTTELGSTKSFNPLAVNVLPDLHLQHAAPWFPLYEYHEAGGLFSTSQPQKSFGLNEETEQKFKSTYGKALGAEDLFYYVYGILHSKEYKRRFGADLKKALPRIPLAKDFNAFSEAGRALADLHVGYENVKPFPLGQSTGQLGFDPKADSRVTKMRFAKKGKEVDRSAIIVNSHLTLTGIPQEAYEYQVNGKSAIEWIMECYQVETDKASGIVNDPNDWSSDPAYIVDLLKRIVRVSVDTVAIVNGLPALKEH